MEPIWKTIIGRQLGAAIDMLGNALDACPPELWRARIWDDEERPELSEFWVVLYHTLFWLDLYLSGAVEEFTPPPGFSLSELDPSGVPPERPYTRAELRDYLAHCRHKCQQIVSTLSDETAWRRCRFSWGEAAYAELLLYAMRHVQEHAAQLNLFLGQQAAAPSGWVAQS